MKLKLLPKFILSLCVVGLVLTVAVSLFSYGTSKSYLEDMYAERLAQRLGVTPATVSFHMKKLEENGLVTSRPDQYYTMYTLRPSQALPISSSTG